MSFHIRTVLGVIIKSTDLLHFCASATMSEDYSSLATAVSDATSRTYSPLATSLKRPVSPSCDSDLANDGSRKRLKGNIGESTDNSLVCNPLTVNCNLVEELAAELQCGCCSELVYRPVLVTPCQHFFCGR